MKIATDFKIIKGKIQLFDEDGNKIPGKGTRWEGNFSCYNNKLTSLEGAPESVGGNFSCSDNKLTSLEGAPESVGGSFYCSDNKLTSLEGAPESVGGSFYCSHNKLTSLEGAPESVGGSFSCYNNKLTSLEGAPESVGGDFSCSHNKLTSLEGAPESVGGSFYCSHNKLTSLEGAPESVGGNFSCYNNKLTSLEGAPKERQVMFSVFLKAGFIFADGILTRKKSQRKISAEITLYKIEKLGYKNNAPIVYVIKSGELFAHGDTPQQAREALLFKTADRDVSAYRNMPMNTVKTPMEWAVVYHIVSGACEAGCKMFMSRQTLKDKYTLAEIIEATKGQYGHDRFVEVVR
jgi:hypothetical protein